MNVTVTLPDKKPKLPLRMRFYKLRAGICYYCGKPTPYHKWTVDHKTPRSRGGSFFTNNRAGCCSTCNQAKGNMTEREFLETTYLPNERRRLLGNSNPPTKLFQDAQHEHEVRRLIKP